MRDYPRDWSTLERQNAASHQKILDEFRHPVTTMSQESMKAHADTAAGHPEKNDRADKSRPAPEK